MRPPSLEELWKDLNNIISNTAIVPDMLLNYLPSSISDLGKNGKFWQRKSVLVIIGLTVLPSTCWLNLSFLPKIKAPLVVNSNLIDLCRLNSLSFLGEEVLRSIGGTFTLNGAVF